jgi:hypothetical protein
MKKQSDGLTKEYDRLLKEHQVTPDQLIHTVSTISLQCLQKVFTSLDFFQMLLCYISPMAYTQYPIMSKWKHVFWHLYKLIKNKSIESISIQPLISSGMNICLTNCIIRCIDSVQ